MIITQEYHIQHNYCTVHLVFFFFSKLLEKIAVKYPSNKVHFEEISAEDMRGVFNDAYVIYSQLLLSRIPRDSLEHFEISVLRHIRVERVSKTIN